MIVRAKNDLAAAETTVEVHNNHGPGFTHCVRRLTNHSRCHVCEVVEAAITQHRTNSIVEYRKHGLIMINHHSQQTHSSAMRWSALSMRLSTWLSQYILLPLKYALWACTGDHERSMSRLGAQSVSTQLRSCTCRVSALRQSRASTSPWYSAIEFMVHTAAKANDAQMKVMMMFSFSSWSTATMTFGTTVIFRNVPTTPLAIFANAIK